MSFTKSISTEIISAEINPTPSEQNPRQHAPLTNLFNAQVHKADQQLRSPSSIRKSMRIAEIKEVKSLDQYSKETHTSAKGLSASKELESPTLNLKRKESNPKLNSNDDVLGSDNSSPKISRQSQKHTSPSLGRKAIEKSQLLSPLADSWLNKSASRISGAFDAFVEVDKATSYDEMADQILTLFPELDNEMDQAKESLEDVLAAIKTLQKGGASSVRFSKKEIGKKFSFTISSNDEAFIEIKRSREDKNKFGGESKYSRIICIRNNKAEKYVGLKIRYKSAALGKKDMEEIAQKRLYGYNSVQTRLTNKNYVVNAPLFVYTYETQHKIQLLSVWEYLGDNIFASATKEGWNFHKTLQAMKLAARSLEYIHSKGFVDRDVKPDNFLGYTRPDGSLVVKKGDLNFLRTIEEAKQSGVAGTFKYLPLEFFTSSAEGYNTQESDMYAFGRSLLEMLNRLDGAQNPISTAYQACINSKALLSTKEGALLIDEIFTTFQKIGIKSASLTQKKQQLEMQKYLFERGQVHDAAHAEAEIEQLTNKVKNKTINLISMEYQWLIKIHRVMQLDPQLSASREFALILIILRLVNMDAKTRYSAKETRKILEHVTTIPSLLDSVQNNKEIEAKEVVANVVV